MKKFVIYLLLAGCVLPPASSRAIDLKQSKVTQVVNDVQIISAADKSTKPATVDAIFKVPDILRTGPNSRAELVAEDQTITRVGANTVFAFDPANRTIDLQKGSLLFHSPKGKGGGTIQTGSATASVLGTTIVVTTTPDGGFKLLVLEGEAEIKFLNGLLQRLNAGQMTFILPGGGMSPIIMFRLDNNTRGSRLINGFHNSLPSLNKIEDEVNKQGKMIKQGKAQDTGLLVGNKASASQVEALDQSILQDYFNKQATFQPVATGKGYLTIDGFEVAPYRASEPVTDALPPAQALSADASINGANLNAHNIFLTTGPFGVTVPGVDAENNFLQNPFSGFFGRNINIKTRNIDMTAYGLVPKFDFLAAQNINISGSLNFNGFVPSVYLTAGGQIAIAPGSTVSANTYYLYLGSFGPMHFDNVNFQNTPGGLKLSSLSDLSLNNGSVNAGISVDLFGHTGVNISGTQIAAGLDAARIFSDSTISLNTTTLTAGGNVVVFGNDDVSVNNSTINSSGDRPNVLVSSFAGSLSLNGGSFALATSGTPAANAGPVGIASAFPSAIQLSAGTDANIAGTRITADSLYVNAGGSIAINGGASIAAATVTLNAGDSILLDNVAMSGTTLNMTAKNTINVGSAAHAVDLSSFADANITAHTPVFENVNFGGNVRITSNNGLLAANPNTGQAVQRGFVNFINGVTYTHTLITSANQSTFINPLSGPGIFLSAGAH